MPPRKHDQYPYPVDDLASGYRWLWQFGRVQDWIDREPDDLPLHARLICDVFWISPAKLLHDLRRDWREALAPDRPFPRSQRRWFS